MDRLFDLLAMPEIVGDLKRRIEKLEEQPKHLNVREPKVFIVADEKEKFTLK